MINYFLQTLVDFIRRRLFPEEQTEELVDCDQLTESTDCSCPSVFSEGHPPDLKRLLEIYKLFYETVDPLFHILEPLHAHDEFSTFNQLGYRLTVMLDNLAVTCAEARFLAKRAAEDVEKALRNEPLDQGYRITRTREEGTFGLTRRLRILQVQMQQEQQHLQQVLQ